jgi:hypothetical protein
MSFPALTQSQQPTTQATRYTTQHNTTDAIAAHSVSNSTRVAHLQSHSHPPTSSDVSVELTRSAPLNDSQPTALMLLSALTQSQQGKAGPGASALCTKPTPTSKHLQRISSETRVVLWCSASDRARHPATPNRFVTAGGGQANDGGDEATDASEQDIVTYHQTHLRPESASCTSCSTAAGPPLSPRRQQSGASTPPRSLTARRPHTTHWTTPCSYNIVYHGACTKSGNAKTADRAASKLRFAPKSSLRSTKHLTAPEVGALISGYRSH